MTILGVLPILQNIRINSAGFFVGLLLILILFGCAVNTSPHFVEKVSPQLLVSSSESLAIKNVEEINGFVKFSAEIRRSDPIWAGTYVEYIDFFQNTDPLASSKSASVTRCFYDKKLNVKVGQKYENLESHSKSLCIEFYCPNVDYLDRSFNKEQCRFFTSSRVDINNIPNAPKGWEAKYDWEETISQRITKNVSPNNKITLAQFNVIENDLFSELRRLSIGRIDLNESKAIIEGNNTIVLNAASVDGQRIDSANTRLIWKPDIKQFAIPIESLRGHYFLHRSDILGRLNNSQKQYADRFARASNVVFEVRDVLTNTTATFQSRLFDLEAITIVINEAITKDQRTAQLAQMRERELEETRRAEEERQKNLPKGYIKLFSNQPGVEIVIDGKSAGAINDPSKPFVAALPAGKRRITAKRDLFGTQTIDVNLLAGDAFAYTFELVSSGDLREEEGSGRIVQSTGTLAIVTSRNDLSIKIDGATKIPPLRLPNIATGRYQIQVVGPNINAFVNIEVDEEGLTTLNLDEIGIY